MSFGKYFHLLRSMQRMSSYPLRTSLPLVPPSILRADCSCIGFSFPKKPNRHQSTALMRLLYLICLPGIHSTSVIALIQITENSQERARHAEDMAWGSAVITHCPLLHGLCYPAGTWQDIATKYRAGRSTLTNICTIGRLLQQSLVQNE